MNWAKAYAILKGIAALGGLMAFVGFAYTYYQDVQLKRSAYDQSWQEAEIYRVVLDAGVEGVSFEQVVSAVQAKYFSDGITAGVNVGIAKAEEVRRAIIGLTAKNAVVRDTEGSYIVPAVARNYLTQDLLFSRNQELQDAAFELVMENPGRYTSTELRDKLIRDGATPREAWATVGVGVFGQPPAFVPVTGFNPALVTTPTQKLRILE